jgi:hypothetical protein
MALVSGLLRVELPLSSSLPELAVLNDSASLAPATFSDEFFLLAELFSAPETSDASSVPSPAQLFQLLLAQLSLGLRQL